MNYTREQIVNAKTLTIKEKNTLLDYFGYNRLVEYKPVLKVTVIETHITDLYFY